MIYHTYDYSYFQCAKLSVLIFRKLLRDNPKVLASFVRSELDEKDVQFIEEMIYHDDDKSSDFQPKVYKICTAIIWDILIHAHTMYREERRKNTGFSMRL